MIHKHPSIMSKYCQRSVLKRRLEISTASYKTQSILGGQVVSLGAALLLSFLLFLCQKSISIKGADPTSPPPDLKQRRLLFSLNLACFMDREIQEIFR